MKGFSNTAAYAVMGAIFALMTASLVCVAPAAAASSGGQLSAIYAGQAAATNASCHASCSQYFLQGNKLRVVVLDQNGQIFTIRTVHLPPGATQQISGSSESSSGTGGLQPNIPISPPCTSCYWVDSGSQQYIVHSPNGNTYLVVVTTIATYSIDANGNYTLIDVAVQKQTIDITTHPK
ncbi:MAG: hypothetical protein ACRER1_06005 [Gammaproteobacteria bacterium]